MRTMRKEFKIAICVILAIWCFVMGIEIGAYREKKDVEAKTTTAQRVDINKTETTTEPTTLPTTTQPVVTDPVTPSGGESDDTTAAPSVDVTVSNDPSSFTKAQIIEKMNTAVNALKAEPNMTAHKVESITISVTDCTVPAAINSINRIIQGIAGDDEQTYTFTNGQGTDEDGNTVTPKDMIPPVKKDFLLTDAGVATASARKDGDNTVYTVTIVSENTTADQPEPTYNAACIGYLNLMALDLTGVTISKANMHYPGSTVEVVCNAEGKVIKLVNILPMTGEGEAKVIGFTGNATFEGGLNETWDITY